MDAELERVTLNRIRLAASVCKSRYDKDLTLAYSGGKDSEVILELTRRCGVPFTVEHNHTTADAPETVYHVREVFSRLERQGIPCKINMPAYKGCSTTMWKLIAEKGIPPTRLQRYCCQVLKEGGGKDSVVMTGVRWAESLKRKNTRGIYEGIAPKTLDKMILNNDNEENRDILETCRIKGKMMCNPIVDWENREVWDYIHSEKLPMNPLYSRGFFRVGCLGCPMAGKKRWKEFRLYPTYEHAYKKAFERMLELRLQRRPDAPTKWKTASDVFRWWMEDKNLDGQLSFADINDDLDDDWAW